MRFRIQGRQLYNEDSESCHSCTQHTYWSSSSFLPNIIKICLKASKLWPAQDFPFRGDNYTMNKVRLSYTQHAYWSSSSSLPNIIKLSQTVWALWPAQDFGFRGDNYIRKTKICLRVSMVLFFTSTKHY